MKMERRDKRLPPPSKDPDDYTIGLHGSEGNSFTPIKLSREQLAVVLAVEDRMSSAAKGCGFQPEFRVYYGGVKNVGNKDYPVWEPSGKPVQRLRVRAR
jgi:hypothetical protein